RIILSFILVALVSCNTNVAKIENNKKGMLRPTKELVLYMEKNFPLDSNTARKPMYSQMVKDSVGTRYYTFFNDYDNSICMFDYDTKKQVKRIIYDKKEPNGILEPMGYHIKNMDSIYVYNKAGIELILTNYEGEVKDNISLNNMMPIKNPEWIFRYPQYYPRTVIPIIEIKEELLFTGQYMWRFPDSLIEKFNFTSKISLKTHKVSFKNKYPKEIYGKGYNWQNPLLKEVFSDLNTNKNIMVFSFPVSHDLYISDLDKDGYKKVFGGSNLARTISSIAKKKESKVSNQEVITQFVETDLYSAIIFDKFRNVYYRFIRRAMPTNGKSHWKDKPIGIIIMNEDFKYLGETELGKWKDWNWENSFVTKEGLNIEFIDRSDIDEVALILKVFKVVDLK
ncbi:MAG: DUF4221 family protein, partial [Confluentibacter sp.]|nr:DUF4221 family protein [Confluentibacter sp.]